MEIEELVAAKIAQRPDQDYEDDDDDDESGEDMRTARRRLKELAVQRAQTSQQKKPRRPAEPNTRNPRWTPPAPEAPAPEEAKPVLTRGTVDGLKVSEVKAALAERGLPAVGPRAILVSRLRDALPEEEAPTKKKEEPALKQVTFLVSNFQITPSTARLSYGGVATFVVASDEPNGALEYALHCQRLDKTVIFESPALSRGQKFKYVFDEPGIFQVSDVNFSDDVATITCDDPGSSDKAKLDNEIKQTRLRIANDEKAKEKEVAAFENSEKEKMKLRIETRLASFLKEEREKAADEDKDPSKRTERANLRAQAVTASLDLVRQRRRSDGVSTRIATLHEETERPSTAVTTKRGGHSAKFARLRSLLDETTQEPPPTTTTTTTLLPARPPSRAFYGGQRRPLTHRIRISS